jgi:hypothetical protein
VITASTDHCLDRSLPPPSSSLSTRQPLPS